MKKHVEIAIIGSGIVGIACAYYLNKLYQKKSIVLLDSRDPMSYTSAQSGDNYRNWWPSQTMTDFTNHSIALMQEIAATTNNAIQLKQSGYALATRRDNIDDLLTTLHANYGTSNTRNQVRQHTQASSPSYQQPYNKDWQTEINGVDVLSNPALIQATFPWFSTEIKHLIHIRRAGDFASQQMGQFMLQQLKAQGIRRQQGRVCGINKNAPYQLELQTAEATSQLSADVVINAAGPYIKEVAEMLGVDLPVHNIFQQKIAFQDRLKAIPRKQPFSIDIDETQLHWSAEERQALAEDPALSWLTNTIDGGIHSRPEGAGDWVKLGWAYNRKTSQPNDAQELIQDPQYDPNFPEIVLRGAARLNPSLSAYVDTLPVGRVHYGGYYTMTEENWPLIGPLDNNGAFVAGALSGFGSMSACATGALCADWVCASELPSYANDLSLNRYKNPSLMDEIADQETGIL